MGITFYDAVFILDKVAHLHNKTIKLCSKPAVLVSSCCGSQYTAAQLILTLLILKIKKEKEKY